MSESGKILVCGSVAIDIIGAYPGSFLEYERKHGVQALNASLQLSSVAHSFGGCGMNISYGLHMHGIDVIPLSIAGLNFDQQYRSHLERLGIDTRHILVDPEFSDCATAIILSDTEGNQLTAFQSGPARSKLKVLPSQVEEIDDVSLAIIAPDDAPVMLRHARDLTQLAIPFMLDPGQGLAEFTREEIDELIALANYIVINGTEWKILQSLAGRSEKELCETVETIIVTRGRGGATIYLREGTQIEISSIRPQAEVDVTGCGDAFRSGYLAGLLRGEPVEVCGQIGALTATYNLESPQTQVYQFTRKEFTDRYNEIYPTGQPPTAD